MSVVAAVVHDQALQLILLLALLAALLDLLVGVIAAARDHALSLDRIAAFVGSHVLMRVVPIAAVSAFASILSAALATFAVDESSAFLAGLAAAAWAAAWAGIAAYLAETLGSLGVNVPTALRGPRS